MISANCFYDVGVQKTVDVLLGNVSNCLGKCMIGGCQYCFMIDAVV